MIQIVDISVPRHLPLPAYGPSSQLDVIKQMLDDLETATLAGRTYVMTKVALFLDGEVDRRKGAFLAPPHSVVARWVEELVHEASGLMPDAREFRQRADRVLDAVAATE